MSTDNTVIDLTNDNGWSMMGTILKEGGLATLDLETDIELLVSKQAYADANTFADQSAKMFSIATKDETIISAAYAQKCASFLSYSTLERLNDSCDYYGVEPVCVPTAKNNGTIPSQFEFEERAHHEPAGHVEGKTASEKYAGCTEYGTELKECLYARATLYPEHADDLVELAKMASDVEPGDMLNIVRGFDEMVGADLPWVENHVGSADYAVYEKRASGITVNMAGRNIAFETMAENADVLEPLGVNVDFDMDNAPAIKNALERLPASVQRAVSKAIA